jgi:hypothetical protein
MHKPKNLNHHLISFNICLALATFASPVFADEKPAEEAVEDYTFIDSIKQGKPLTSFRLRYENVQQDGLQPPTIVGAQVNPTAAKDLKEADGITLRSLIGWQSAPFHNFSFAAQIINVSKFEDNFNDSTNNTLINSVSNQPDKVDYAKIVDPDDTDINQLYVDWTGIKNTRFRVGRQAINLDNVRYIGDIGFRQVMQVMDGVTVLNKSLPDTEIYLGHMERVKQITTKLRAEGALEMVNIRYRFSPTEFLVGYGYLSSFDDLGLGRSWFGNAGVAGTPTALTAGNAVGKNGAANQKANQGNKTFGLRLDGTHPFNPNFRAAYTAEYAKQSDYSDGDSRIDAHYYKLGGGLGYDNFNMRIDQELLSSNNSQYAFQTPFGTNHLFQGWVDKFLATPVEGIQDTFVTATYKYDDFLFFADYHWLKSDEDFHTVGGGAALNGSKYGKEWNLAATWTPNKNWMGKIEYGQFTEDDKYALLANTANNVAGNRGRIRDTEKLWLTAMYSF